MSGAYVRTILSPQMWYNIEVMDDPITPPVAPQNAPAEATGGQKVEDPGYTHKDLESQSIREIAEGQEPPKPVEPEAPQEPETPAPPVETPQLTAEEIAKKTADELEARAKEDVPAEPEPTAKEKIYLEWEKKFETDNKRPPTYLEALSFVEEQAVATIQERQEQAAREQQEKDAQALKQKEETDKQVNSIVDDELNDLYNANKLTKIKDPNNPADQGVVERKALFDTWQQINTQRAAEGKPPIYSATRIYEFYYKKPNAQPAGANAPVAGSAGSATPPSEEQSYTYQDIKKPWQFFRRG